jgi:pimeloyl-ACP methyl ester carboxylesterase
LPIKPVRDEYIIAGDLTFHYVQWGTHGSPIIFIHGITANAFCFQAFADDLSSKHRVFAYDLRGRGDSDKYVNFPKLNHYTIAFGIESGPATEIRNFIEKE